MITGWATQPVDGRLLDAPLPAPHVAVYRDGEIAVPVSGAAEVIVPEGTTGGAVTARAGLGADGGAAVVAEIEVREVFHALLLDTLGLRFGWERCSERPASTWERA